MSSVVGKGELTRIVSEKSGLNLKESGKAVAAVFEGIQESLAVGDKVTIVGFGSFEAKAYAERPGRNPQTKEAIVIPAHKAARFKAAPAFNAAVD